MDQDQVKGMFLNKKTFENRRRMAWLSMIAITLIVVAAFVMPATAVSIHSVIETIVMTYAAIVMTYMGTTMIPVVFGKKMQKKDDPVSEEGSEK